MNMNNKLKIIGYAICLNEEHQVDDFVNNMLTICDKLIIVDTGSVDNTIFKLSVYDRVYVVEKKFNPWDFAEARNYCLSLIDDDCDICIAVDLDERFSYNTRDELQKIWICNETNNVRYPLQSTEDIMIYGFKIHSRHGYKWVYPIHEILEFIDSLECQENVLVNESIICSHKQTQRDRSDYRRLLKNMVDDSPLNPRFSYQYARELLNHNCYKQSFDEYQRCLTLCDCYDLSNVNGNSQIQWACWRSMGYISQLQNRSLNMNLRYQLKAFACYPYARESYLWLSNAWELVGNYNQAYSMLRSGLSITDKKLSFEIETQCWNSDELLNKLKYLKNSDKKESLSSNDPI